MAADRSVARKNRHVIAQSAHAPDLLIVLPPCPERHVFRIYKDPAGPGRPLQQAVHQLFSKFRKPASHTRFLVKYKAEESGKTAGMPGQKIIHVMREGDKKRGVTTTARSIGPLDGLKPAQVGFKVPS